MSKTAMDLFERAMHLSDNGDETNGQFDTQDNREYKYRTPALVNTYINEIYPYSDTCVREKGKRPCHEFITSIDDEIDLDNYCFEVAAYGLAARLFTDENAALANYYQQEYERRLAWLMNNPIYAAEAEAIEDVYSGSYIDADGNIQYFTGIYPHNHFAEW